MKPRDARREPDTAELLLPTQQQHGQPVAHAGRSYSLLTAAGFAFLTINSAMAVYRSHVDRGTVAFVVFSYLDLLLLFYCLRQYESAEHGSQLRERLKVAVWSLTTALTLLFSFKVAAIMPPAVAVVVWLMAFGTVAGGFYAFFCCNQKQ